LLSGKSEDKKLYSAWINVKNQLEALGPAERKLVKHVFTQPMIVSWQTLLEASEQSVQNSWQNRVYSSYSVTLKGKFPFNVRGDDAAVIDFDAMMKPKVGQLWAFLESDLKEFIVQQGDQWHSKTWLGYGMNFEPSIFRALENAGRATMSLYRDSETAEMKYWIYPVAVPGISESTILVDDSGYHYRNEPQEWREFKWSLNESQKAKLSLRANGASQNDELQYDGPWSFVRLIHSAQVTHVQGTEFAMQWVVNNGTGRSLIAKFHLKADRVGSLLNPNVLTGLSLPEKLFKG
jgi:type VI secretion system protein ImpL